MSNAEQRRLQEADSGGLGAPVESLGTPEAASAPQPGQSQPVEAQLVEPQPAEPHSAEAPQ